MYVTNSFLLVFILWEVFIFISMYSIHIRESEVHIRKREQARIVQRQPSNYEVGFLFHYLIDLFMCDSDPGKFIVCISIMS
jgi:hypothetical protein